MKKTHRTLPGAAIPRAVPYVDYIARAQKGEQRMMRGSAVLFGIVVSFCPLLFSVEDE